jgi:hypothetical protein
MGPKDVERPVMRIAGRVGIDVHHAKLRELAVFVIGFHGVLRSNVHKFPSLLAPAQSGLDRVLSRQ